MLSRRNSRLVDADLDRVENRSPLSPCQRKLPVRLERSAHFTATRNACAVCTPLGACLVFCGIERALPLLHGSQGCSTYIRRYLIEHYREPIDIASSNFSESSAVQGGAEIFRTALTNVIRQYAPALVGIATTCLSETIGDDVQLLPVRIPQGTRGSAAAGVGARVDAQLPGDHADGFHAAVRAVADALAEGGEPLEHVNVLPGMVSPADLRHLPTYWPTLVCAVSCCPITPTRSTVRPGRSTSACRLAEHPLRNCGFWVGRGRRSSSGPRSPRP